jgi:voltage-gated potassium channel
MAARSLPDARARFAYGVLVLAGVIALGTAGYMAIERWSFFDSLFMTVTTVTTVGYREVRPLDTGGRILTLVLIIFGVGTAFYLLTTFVALVIEGDLGTAFGLTRMKNRIEHLSNHSILCGYGRVGEEIAREFSERNLPFVVVEQNVDAIARCEEDGHLLIKGDASSDDVLHEAGIERAHTLLAASDSDSGNTYITLTAKALNPSIFVVARAGHRDAEPRVRRAGADRVISPYTLSGRRMALSALQPGIVDFIDTLAVGGERDQILAEVEITSDSGLLGMYMRQLLDTVRVTVLGLQRHGGELIVAPREDVRLEDGDRVIVLGPEAEISKTLAARRAVLR